MTGCFMVLLALTACDDTLFSKPFPTADDTGGGEVTATGFDGVVEIFDANCIACHGSGSGSGGMELDVDPCAEVVDVDAEGYAAKRVAPGDPDASVLFNKVSDSGLYGGVMPYGGPKMADSNIELIRQWIADGADCSSGSGDGGATDGGARR